MRTLARPCRFEQYVRRSRFIAHAAPVTRETDTLAFLESVANPQATHNCWAWRVNLKYRFSDDGEPSGTAGRPMLGVIEKRELDGVMVVVTRHFGGIKLGAGGLARAYAGSVAKCLDEAVLAPIVKRVACVIEADFALAGVIHRIMDEFQAAKRAESFEAGGLRLRLVVDADQLDRLKEALLSASRGRARIRSPHDG